MLSKVVSGEQLHSGPFCAGWDEEGIGRMEAYSDHTGELPKRGRESEQRARRKSQPAQQCWGHRSRLLCKHQTWIREDIVNPRTFDVI